LENKKTFIQKIRAAGPAAVITSAFVGPGTITTATNAGVTFGYALLWAVIFSGFASIVIMNMASRLAIKGKKNIINAAVELVPGSAAWRIFALALIGLVAALTGFGFEAGNLIGATVGFEDIFGLPQWLSAFFMGSIAMAAVIFSTPRIVELIMKTFVAVMGIIFVISAIIVTPPITEILRGLIPTIPEEGIVTTIALVGTTIIAINIVFHSVASAEKWADTEELEDSYFDTKMNVSLGVLMTLGLIIATSATLFGTGTEVDSPIVFAEALEVTLGGGARMFAATGLVLAGLSSAIATPYMVGVIWARIFKWDLVNDWRPKAVAGVIVVFGTLLAMFGTAPVPIILFAQATSGVFLPFVAVLFILATNSKALGEYRNNRLQNVVGIIMVAVMFILGFRTLWNVFSQLFS